MDVTPLVSPVLLDKKHDLTLFDCGIASLNDYLKKHSFQNHQNRSARTYVATRGGPVVGYYTLAAGSVSKSDVPARVAKGLGNYPIPIILLARLAVDESEQGRGLGKALLKDSIWSAMQAADIIGCRLSEGALMPVTRRISTEAL